MNNTGSKYASMSITVAGILVSIKSTNGNLLSALQTRYKDYLGEGEAHLEVIIKLKGKSRESPLLDTGTTFEKKRCIFTAPGYEGFIDIDEKSGELNLSSKSPVEEVDYYLRVAYALLTFDTGGMMFHAAGIVRNGEALLFFGHSGSGKTTVARVSRDDIILNDDLLLILPRNSGVNRESKWMAYGTPFWNPTQVAPTNQCGPVVGLFRLVQDLEVYLEPMGSGQALAELVSNIPVIPDDPIRGEILLQRSIRFLESVPAQRLHFLPDDSFWNVIQAGGGSDKVVS